MINKTERGRELKDKRKRDKGKQNYNKEMNRRERRALEGTGE